MDLVPVIDLLGGVVVHARRGERGAYRPIRSGLCDGADPWTIVEALLALHPFRALYIADLDAIGRTGDHAAVVADLARRFPGLTLWVDGGAATAAAARLWLDHGAGVVVVGSETLASADNLAAIRAGVPAERVALSLDYRGDAFMGPPGLDAAPGLWPDRLIAMTLARVGSDAGPDLDRLAAVRAAGGGRAVYAAGGVRSPADLAALAERGAAGVLLASALHDGRIVPDRL
ncbi:HisA/HisF-related TIM barrel protein [Azospirillum halopraeferens]|uniref:HisA/HisF-related TIM barrel protein n=1 Tax=Azospirillum halopraeferens TaxID=34010 RepID=UPI0004097F57|nr:HisA/HisF-related TIM barrel protein [Azospirillum halopraeferens]